MVPAATNKNIFSKHKDMIISCSNTRRNRCFRQFNPFQPGGRNGTFCKFPPVHGVKNVMRGDFWLKRWEDNEIRFHQDRVNTYLERFWNQLGLQRSGQVFVPLCGKSRDLLWLSNEGHPVLGVEISPIAVEAFFNENDMAASRRIEPRFTRWYHGSTELLCGDFFDLGVLELQGVTGVYDRASLVAFPPEQRKSYVSHLTSLLPDDVGMLLVATEYPNHEMEGPPFSVSEDEICELYRDSFNVCLVHVHEALNENPHFRERGLSKFEEKVYLLTSK